MRYGCFRLGSSNGDIPYHIFELGDIANNIDKLTTKEIKALAGDLFVEGRSKKKISELKTDIIKELNSGTRGSENLEDCIGSSPNLQKVITIDEFVATYHK